MTSKQRYDILASFDRAKIQAELGESYANMGEVYAALSAAFELLTPAERDADEIEVESQLSAMAAELGRRGGKKGGAVKTPRKTAASRENGKKGGRPVALARIDNASAECERLTISYHPGSKEIIATDGADIREIIGTAKDERDAYEQVCAMYNRQSYWGFEDLYA